jgi:hypothetical protein
VRLCHCEGVGSNPSTTMFFCFSGTSRFTEEKAHKLVINS